MKAVMIMQEASANNLATCGRGRGQERRESDEILGTNLADSADVLIARLFVETKVLVQTETNIISIQAIGEFMEVQQVLLKGTRNS